MNEYSRLRERYRSLSTDELLDINVSGGLTELAKPILDQELATRGASAPDYAAARVARAIIDADRESNTKRFLVRVYLGIAVAVVMIVVGLWIEFFSD